MGEIDNDYVEIDCKHWFSYPGFAEWYADFSKPELQENTGGKEEVDAELVEAQL